MREKKLTNTGKEQQFHKKKNITRRSTHRSSIKISPAEFRLFKGIWRWKVLTYPLAKELFYKNLSTWRFYKKIKKLLFDGYLVEKVGASFTFDVLQLTKKSYELIKYDLGETKQDRFLVHSVDHDYMATAFHIGDFAFFNTNDVDFFTEQELQAFDTAILPDWIPKLEEHIPDGLLKIKGKDAELYVGVEMDLHLKPMIKYAKTAYYYDGLLSKFDVVFWVCDKSYIMENIYHHLFTLRLRRPSIFHFILLDDFKKFGWNAKARSGHFKDKSIHDILVANTRLNCDFSAAKSRPENFQEIFFPKRKSPLVSKS